MAELMMFDLQRFALHDGPGIRTTVFLKGCPLNCVWCHNPESKKHVPQLCFLEKKCISCGRCQAVCPHQVHVLSPEGHRIDFDRCRQCGRCVEVCPSQALKIFGTTRSSDDILREVLKDRDFYRRSGGGLTVSGGEPMQQFEGLKELLRKARENDLHICLDTSGQAATAKYEEIAEDVDLFLFDYKMTDPLEHKKYIGADNRLILENLDVLCCRGSRIYLRCPIIPGINNNESHYRKIAELSRKYEQIEQVNLMVYHDMAKGKTGQIGEEYPLASVKTVEAEEKKQIYAQLESFGCLRLHES